jgi:hypothetical protein
VDKIILNWNEDPGFDMYCPHRLTTVAGCSVGVPSGTRNADAKEKEVF